MISKTALTLILIGTMIYQIQGQNFTVIEVNDSQGVYSGETVWFDFDNDGDLDFITTGQSSVNDLHTRIYQNNGNDSFDIHTSLKGYSETGLQLLNLNNDEFIDLLIMGRAIGADNDLLFLINDNTTFSPENVLNDNLSIGGYGSNDSRDWNRDIKEDILITGVIDFEDGNAIYTTRLYSKEEQGSYTSSMPIDVGAYLSDIVFFDLDNDLDLDLIISGRDNGEFPRKTEIYTNENDNFILSDNLLEPLQNSAIDISDYNGDGFLDVILIGLNEFLRDTVLLYKNVDGTLMSIENSGLNGHVGRSGSVQWGDYDNDGDSDLLFHGQSSSGQSFEIMINQGNDQFIHLDEENFENLASGSAAWGDYDNDGDLDILTTGYVDVNDPKLIIYRNDLRTPNSPPSIPTNLTVNSFDLNNVDISWDISADNETPQVSLTYNLHIEDSESKTVFSSYADLESGFLKRVWSGNMGISNLAQFKNLDDGTYTVYLQAIDAGYKTSPFSDPSTFYMGLPTTPENLSINEIDNLQLIWDDLSNNEEFFIIERKIGEGMIVKFDSVTANVESFTDKKLPPSFSVEYRVQASNPNGTSNYSSITSSTIDGTPSELSLSMSSNGIKLDWVDNSITEDYFIVERKLSESDSFEKIDSVSSNITEFVDTDNLEDEITYRVYSKNEWGFSDYSEEVSIAILGTDSGLSSTINLYPNPFEKSLTIRTESFKIEDSNIQIFDLEGKSVQFTTYPIDSQSLQVILNNNSNVFFVMIKNDIKTHLFKVLKK